MQPSLRPNLLLFASVQSVSLFRCWTALLFFALVNPSFASASPLKVSAVDVSKKVIYHSPQHPGYTSWVGAWLLPDGTLMVSFHQATGQLQGRPGARKDILERLSWPPAGEPQYDMTGLDLQTIHLLSKDGGETWSQVSSERWDSPMNGWTCHPEMALQDGSILRAVWGQYLPFYNVPQTGYTQYSTDMSQTWGPRVPFFDEKKWMTFPMRVRGLQDGRLAVSGAIVELTPDIRTRRDWNKAWWPALWLSDNSGKSWSEPIRIWDEVGVQPSEENDFAELPNGNLLIIFRVDEAKSRWQSVLIKNGQTFTPGKVKRTLLPHSGAPELLMTREGLVLHIASTGISYTADDGATWNTIENLRTGYYPRSVQLKDGRIVCIYHVGSDDPFGKRDQQVEWISFRLKVEK